MRPRCERRVRVHERCHTTQRALPPRRHRGHEIAMARPAPITMSLSLAHTRSRAHTHMCAHGTVRATIQSARTALRHHRHNPTTALQHGSGGGGGGRDPATPSPARHRCGTSGPLHGHYVAKGSLAAPPSHRASTGASCCRGHRRCRHTRTLAAAGVLLELARLAVRTLPYVVCRRVCGGVHVHYATRNPIVVPKGARPSSEVAPQAPGGCQRP